jgi:voltage-gated potassium channel
MKKTLTQIYSSLTLGQKLEVEILIVVIILLLGMVFYHFIEGWRYLDALYFSSTTLAAVGYGDFFPKTDIGKIFTIFYLFIGIPFFVYTTSLFISENRKNP